MNRFVHERKDAWQRLENLLRLLNRPGALRRFDKEEVRELGHSYRRTASDLAIARAESRDPRLVGYLNNLVIRAHGRIYRADARAGASRLRTFFTREFPRTFRRTWKYTATAFAVFMVFAVAGFAGTWRDADFSEVAGVHPIMREHVINARVRWWERINRENQVEASGILTNNIGVTFYAFALGAVFGLGTIYIMAMNGASVGAILALTYLAGFGDELVTFMVAHGVIELSCIFIAGGAGLLIGSAFLMPGELSRADALRVRGRAAVQLIIGCVPFLFLAGIIEGFISPAPISPFIKFGVAALTGLTLYSYLLLAGREEERGEGEQ